MPAEEGLLRELEVAHRRELSRLLRQAVLVRVDNCGPPLSWISSKVARTSQGSPSSPSSLGERRAKRRSTSLWRWRRRVRRALWKLEEDGVILPQRDLLERLANQPLVLWPRPVELARELRAQDGGELSLFVLGRALLAEGRAEEAVELFQSLLTGGRMRERWRVLEELSRAHAQAGRPQQASLAMEGAADEPMSSVRCLVEGLVFALEAGDVARTRRAAARLDLLVSSEEPEFVAAIEGLRRGARRVRDRAWRGELRPRGGSPSELVLGACLAP